MNPPVLLGADSAMRMRDAVNQVFPNAWCQADFEMWIRYGHLNAVMQTDWDEWSDEQRALIITIYRLST